ncbi:hypothetical protein EDD85DRAFT_853947 [Armillaria nabsnona]|nr:hypothetical protein EDD85DRAFT_853947 [Armillaria nabsnona]
MMTGVQFPSRRMTFLVWMSLCSKQFSASMAQSPVPSRHWKFSRPDIETWLELLHTNARDIFEGGPWMTSAME